MACTKRKFLPLHSPSFVGFAKASPDLRVISNDLDSTLRELGEKDPSRGVSDTPPRHERQTPHNGGSNYPLQVSPGKTKWGILHVGKGERLCRATPARTATSAACSQSRSSWCAKAAGRRYPWERGRALHAGALPLRRRSSSPPRLHPQIELLDRIDELLARMDAKLRVHVFHVALRRVLRDDQLVGNVPNRSAARK